MCRNIRVLHHFEPPTTPEEIRAAATQYVRKVSGARARPAKDDVRAMERAIDAITKATTQLLEALPERGDARTREGERERAKARWASREARIVEASHSPKRASSPAEGARRRGAARR